METVRSWLRRLAERGDLRAFDSTCLGQELGPGDPTRDHPALPPLEGVSFGEFLVAGERGGEGEEAAEQSAVNGGGMWALARFP